jgi:hypothetical protein
MKQNGSIFKKVKSEILQPRNFQRRGLILVKETSCLK